MLRHYVLSLIIILPLALCAQASDFHKLKAQNLNNQEVDFSTYKDKVVLIVNTASRCGYTPQLKGMQELHDNYSSKGLVVLGFPSNDFKQEDKDGKDLKKFCRLNYGVNFTMFKKSHVNGANRNSVYKYLVSQSSKPTQDIQWNFEKFLVNKKGQVIARYPSQVRPTSEQMKKAIETALNNK